MSLSRKPFARPWPPLITFALSEHNGQWAWPNSWTQVKVFRLLIDCRLSILLTRWARDLGHWRAIGLMNIMLVAMQRRTRDRHALEKVRSAPQHPTSSFNSGRSTRHTVV